MQNNFRNGKEVLNKATKVYLDRIPLALIFTKHLLHLFRLMLEANLHLIQSYLLRHDIFELFLDTFFFFFSFLNVEDQKVEKQINERRTCLAPSNPCKPAGSSSLASACRFATFCFAVRNSPKRRLSWS